MSKNNKTIKQRLTTTSIEEESYNDVNNFCSQSGIKKYIFIKNALLKYKKEAFLKEDKNESKS